MFFKKKHFVNFHFLCWYFMDSLLEESGILWNEIDFEILQKEIIIFNSVEWEKMYFFYLYGTQKYLRSASLYIYIQKTQVFYYYCTLVELSLVTVLLLVTIYSLSRECVVLYTFNCRVRQSKYYVLLYIRQHFLSMIVYLYE